MEFTYESRTENYLIRNSIDELESLVKELFIKYEDKVVPGSIRICFQMTPDFNWENFTAIFPPLPKFIDCDIVGYFDPMKSPVLRAMCFTDGHYDLEGAFKSKYLYLTNNARVGNDYSSEIKIAQIKCYNDSLFVSDRDCQSTVFLFNKSTGRIKNLTSEVVVHDQATIECDDVTAVHFYDNSRGIVDNSFVDIYSNNVVLRTKRCCITTRLGIDSAQIYDYFSTILCNSPSYDYTKIFLHYSEIRNAQSYVNLNNNICNSPKEYLSPNRIYYKCVFKNSKGIYRSLYNPSFTYKIGETVLPDAYNNDPTEMCGAGIHIASAEWALDHYYSDSTTVLLEVEVPEDAEIVVPYRTDGKLRASKVKVLREVPVEELGAVGLFFKNFYRVGSDANA